MQKAILRLSKKSDPSDFYDLNFNILDTPFTQKWIDCVLEAQQKQYPISEPWAIYNINNKLDEDFIKNNLNRLIKEVDSVEELFGFTVEDVREQDTLNKVHSIFEKHHGKLDEWLTNPLFDGKPQSFRKNLSEINQFVHACENLNGSPKVRVVWFDLPKQKRFTEQDYALFTNEIKFGSIYTLYCDVGKPIESLAVDNDDHHHDVVPNIHYSADCVVFFKSSSAEDKEKLEKKIKSYLEQKKDFLEQKGYTIGDPVLTTGRIELARIDSDLTQQQLLDKIKDYDNIQSFFII